MDKVKITAANSTFAIGEVSCSADSLVVAESFVLRIKFSGKKPTHRKSSKRSSKSSAIPKNPKPLAFLLTHASRLTPSFPYAFFPSKPLRKIKIYPVVVCFLFESAFIINRAVKLFIHFPGKVNFTHVLYQLCFGGGEFIINIFVAKPS